MAKYENAITNMIIENRFSSSQSISNWEDNSNKNNCQNTSQYFKISEGSGCTFKTSDGVWWYIDDIQRVIISTEKITNIQELKIKADSTADDTAFYLITSFDNKGTAYIKNHTVKIMKE